MKNQNPFHYPKKIQNLKLISELPHLKNHSPLHDICQHIETQMTQVPGWNLRTWEDDLGRGSPDHLISLLQPLRASLTKNETERVIAEFCDAGPITHLINDPLVSEIMINAKNNIWYERGGQVYEGNDHFYSSFTFEYFIQRIFNESKVHTDIAQPAIDGTWRGFRLHVISPPLSPRGTVLTLRRHPQNPWTLKKLSEQQWADPHITNKIIQLIKERKTFLIAGNTGSGKTSLLSACLQEIFPEERALILEDTAEIAIPNDLSLRLLTREDVRLELPSFSLTDLLRQSLRMRPDRLILGEIRGAEAKDLLLLFSTGHKGGMATLHAQDPHECLLRLEILIQMGAPQWQTNTIQKLIFHGVQYVLMTQRTLQGQRQFAGAYRLTSLESCGFLLDREF